MRIIAVFGPTKRDDGDTVPAEILRAARDAGAQIAGARHLVLTGGDSLGDESVKDVASAGADAAGGPRAAVLPGPGDDARRWVLPSGLRGKRNFLEALMCDAAIAFASDGPGTPAEVACAFALQRPVALVDGDRWRAVCDLDLDDAGAAAKAAAKLLEDAQAFFAAAKPPAVADPEFDKRIASCLDPSRGSRLLRDAQAHDLDKRPYRYFDLPQNGDMSAVVDWAGSVALPPGAPRREVPAIKTLERTHPDGETIRGRFLTWLEEIEQGP